MNVIFKIKKNEEDKKHSRAIEILENICVGPTALNRHITYAVLSISRISHRSRFIILLCAVLLGKDSFWHQGISTVCWLGNSLYGSTESK